MCFKISQSKFTVINYFAICRLSVIKYITIHILDTTISSLEAHLKYIELKFLKKNGDK